MLKLYHQCCCPSSLLCSLSLGDRFRVCFQIPCTSNHWIWPIEDNLEEVKIRRKFRILILLTPFMPGYLQLCTSSPQLLTHTAPLVWVVDLSSCSVRPKCTCVVNSTASYSPLLVSFCK